MKENMGDIDNLIARLLNYGTSAAKGSSSIKEWELKELCFRAIKVILAEPTFLELKPPITVCGDFHGQFFDMIRVLKMTGLPPNTNYLFLGDYVDRGNNSLETICLLLAFKVRFPHNLFLLRGNHESSEVNYHYGFYDECVERFSSEVWKAFNMVFDCLPLAALVGNEIFCCHGGLSPDLHNLDQIRTIKRPLSVPEKGLVCDLLWSDPDSTVKGWAPNAMRKTSYVFGEDVVKDFVSYHSLLLICRAHQVVPDGFEFFADKKLVTVYSAPGYDGGTNLAATMSITRNMTCTFQVSQFRPQGVTSEADR